MNNWTQWTPLIVAACMMLPAMISDVRHRRIPNFLCLGGFLAGIALHGWLGGWPAAGWALLSGVTLLVATFGLFAIGWMGAGDVKLLATAGAIGGDLTTALNIVLATALVGGLLGLIMLLRRRARIRDESLLGERSLDDIIDNSRRITSIPYALAIGLGTIVAIAWRLA
jgi:prepilin peptidase CpaA